ncbi:MAG: YeeE/YedE family protein [Xanthomonadales bacterium]|nr:YeeE/YedE family protein [Xanthomonadales bacterium]NNL94419.1 YeeE/YedE family protein [Xanthomonadales bacterium]
MKRLVLAALAGALFGAGLVISGMSNPNKVLNFLDVLGPWDASLLVVMMVAVPVTAIGFKLAWRQSAPVCGGAFQNPPGRHIDGRLLGGAAMFGVGWGLAGYCPGPALTALAIAPREGLIFVGAMLAGGLLFKVTQK